MAGKMVIRGIGGGNGSILGGQKPKVIEMPKILIFRHSGFGATIGKKTIEGRPPAEVRTQVSASSAKE